MSHHELEEEPGVLQDRLAHSTATDHPLQSQLLVKQLEAGAEVTQSRGARPYPSGEHDGEDEAGGLGLEQQAAMQERGGRCQMCPFPGLSRPCWAQGMGALDSSARPRPTLRHPPLPPATFCIVGLGWVAGGAEEELSR